MKFNKTKTKKSVKLILGILTIPVLPIIYFLGATAYDNSGIPTYKLKDLKNKKDRKKIITEVAVTVVLIFYGLVGAYLVDRYLF